MRSASRVPERSLGTHPGRVRCERPAPPTSHTVAAPSTPIPHRTPSEYRHRCFDHLSPLLMFCKFGRRDDATKPRSMLRKPPYRVARARLSNGLRLAHDRDAAPAHRRRSASTCAPARATSGAKRTACRTSSSTCCSAARAAIPSSFALNLAIEELGGTLYAETGRDYSLYQIPLHPRHVARGLEILGDLFATPAFRDIDLERKIILEEILEDLDDRGRNINVDDLSRALAWDEHPLGFPITGPAAQRAPLHGRGRARPLPALLRRRQHGARVAGPLRHGARCGGKRAAAFARVPRGTRRAAAGAAPERPRPALPRRPQRIGADAGARPVSRAARERSRTTRRCAR